MTQTNGMPPALTHSSILRGQKALIVGVANDRSIAWGCAEAMHRSGAEIALTYLNDKARPYVEPLASAVEASLLLPLEVRAPRLVCAPRERDEADQRRKRGVEEDERPVARPKVPFVDLRVVGLPEPFLDCRQEAEPVAEAGEPVPPREGLGEPGGDLEVFGLGAERIGPQVDHPIPFGDLGLALPGPLFE